MSVTRKKYSAEEKAKIALEALKGTLTQAEITAKYGVHASQIIQWKNQLKEHIGDIFTDRKKQEDRDKDKYIDELHQQIGQLTIEVSWLKKNLNCSNDEKVKMIEPNHYGHGIILWAMVELQSGSKPTSDIAAKLGFKIHQIRPVRAKLIKKGMIYSPTYGEVAFTVPLFGDFMKRVMPDFKNRTNQ